MLLKYICEFKSSLDTDRIHAKVYIYPQCGEEIIVKSEYFHYIDR